jgi:hypothetical protein
MGGVAYGTMELDGMPSISPIGEPWPLWVYTEHGERLHVATRVDKWDGWDGDDLDWTSGPGKTLCGYEAYLYYPGVFSRLGMPRCAYCCHRLKIPRGEGHPKNDPNLRPLFNYPPSPKPIEPHQV